MSQENVEVVRSASEAWSRGGLEAWLKLFDPAVVWTVRPDLPDAGVYRGHEGLRQLSGRFEEVLADQWYEPQEFIECGDEFVIVPLHWGGRGRMSGVEVAERQGETWVFTVRNGKIREVREYRHMSEALEAAGLSE
jgi:ketosteroid isomerase-like protein